MKRTNNRKSNRLKLAHSIHLTPPHPPAARVRLALARKGIWRVVCRNGCCQSFMTDVQPPPKFSRAGCNLRRRGRIAALLSVLPAQKITQALMARLTSNSRHLTQPLWR